MSYRDMPPAQRALADRLYERRDGALWVGPCGHPSAVMVVDDDLTIRCVASAFETHQPSPEHFLGACTSPTSGCVITKCGRTYAAEDLPGGS